MAWCKETTITTSFDLCVFCEGQLFRKDVELLVRGGDNVATVTVPADVCLRCGQQIYAHETSLKLEEIERKLAANDTEDFQPKGKHFQVVNSGLPLSGITDRPNPPSFGRGRVVTYKELQSRAGREVK